MLFDAHAHPAIITERALVASASTSDFDMLKQYRYRALGAISEGKEKNIEVLEMAASEGFHIGEIGLDRRFGEMDGQIRLFRAALSIARQYDRIAIIHTVREYGRTLSILEKEHPRAFIMHGFTGSYETALEIIRLGGIISLSPNAERAKAFEKLIALPFLIETDMRTGKEEMEALAAWNSTLSRRLGFDAGERSWEIIREIL